MLAAFHQRALVFVAIVLQTGCYNLDLAEHDGGQDSGAEQGVSDLRAGDVGTDVADVADAADDQDGRIDASPDTGPSGSADGQPAVGSLIGTTCDTPKALACDGQLSQYQLVCENQTWRTLTVCNDGEYCNSTTGDSTTGRCLPIVPDCLGKRPGDHVCIDRTIRACGPDLVTAPIVNTCDTPVDECARCRPLVLASDQAGASAVAIAGEYVYWSNRSDNTDTNGIFRVSRHGGAVETVAPGHTTPSLVADRSHVYWFNPYSAPPMSDQGESNGVYRVAVTGGAPSLVAADPGKGANIVGAPEIAVDDTHVYWTVWSSPDVKRAPKQGGAPEILASSSSGNALAIVVAGGVVYWKDGAGPIMQVPTTGGEATVFAVAGAYLTALAVDQSYVYWSNGLGGGVSRLGQSGGTPEVLLSGQTDPFYLAVDASHLYWTDTNDGSLLKTPLSGGAPVVIDSAPPAGIGGLAVDDTSLCWSTPGSSTSQGTITCIDK